MADKPTPDEIELVFSGEQETVEKAIIEFRRHLGDYLRLVSRPHRDKGELVSKAIYKLSLPGQDGGEAPAPEETDAELEEALRMLQSSPGLRELLLLGKKIYLKIPESFPGTLEYLRWLWGQREE